MSFIKSSFWTFITLAISAIFSLLWVIVSARILEPQGVGVLAVVILYPSLFFTIGNFTFGVGTIYQMGEKRYPFGNFVANSIFMAIVMGVILYAVFTVTSVFLKDTLYKGIDIWYFYVSFIVVIFYLLVYQLSSVLQGIKAISNYNIVNLVRSGLAVALLIVLTGLFNFGVMGGVIAFVFSFIVASMVVLYFVKKKVKDWKLNFTLLKDTLKNSSKLHIATIATFIYSQVGIMIANYYLNSVEVGYLAIALLCAQFLFIVPQATQVVLYPETASLNVNQSVILSTKVCRHTVLWVAVFAVLFILLARYIVVLFMGEAFISSAMPLIILIPGILCSTVAQVISALWLRKGWYWFMALSGIALAIIGIILQLILIPSLGIIGSAIATSVTYIIGFLIVLVVHFLYFDKKIWRLFVMQTEDWIQYKNIFNQVRVAWTK